MKEFVAAIDQGTTSTRFVIFDRGGNEIAKHQLEHAQILPRPGWVEHDPMEILECTRAAIEGAMRKGGVSPQQLAGIGVTNQRETTVLWNPKTGKPWHNAIVWQDTRTDRLVGELLRSGQGGLIRTKAGLPPATYFSAGKIQWILDNVAGVRQAAGRGEALFGNIDTWLIWNLTGGPDGGAHVTDVTNASRTMLMDLATLDWDEELLRVFDIPRSLLPEIRPSSDTRGYGFTRTDGPLKDELPLCADLGDQQAAMVGQVCFSPGSAKNTYGTGNFMLLNTGTEVIPSPSGLLTTVCYKMGDNPANYALEGSVAVTGSAVQWLRDQLGIISSAAEIEALAGTVEDSGGVYFVPAFSGLFAPYWRADARGVIVGLSRYNTKAHIARATLEAICYQTKDVLDAMTADSNVKLEVLKVDGGATINNSLMQLQADILGVEVVRPANLETTVLGGAYAAGLATGLWTRADELCAHWKADRTWIPRWTVDQREEGHAKWKRAVSRSLDWIRV